MIYKDCIHNEVCKYGENRMNGGYCTGEKCKHFKNKANFVEVVFCENCEIQDECSQQIHLKPGGYTGINFCSYGERK